LGQRTGIWWTNYRLGLERKGRNAIPEKAIKMRWLARLDRGFFVFLVFAVAFSLAPIASAGWDRPSVTLKPGENVIVGFANTDNVAVNLILENISAPEALLPFVVVYPTSIVAFDNTNIFITFATVPRSILSTITKDTYSIKIVGLVVYLDLTENQPSQENILAELENLRHEFENLLWRQTISGNDIIQINARLNALYAKVYENSDNYDAQMADLKSWIQSANENQWANINGLLVNQNATVAQANDENRLYAYAAIGTAVALFFVTLLVIFLRKPKSVPTQDEPSKKDPSELKPADPLEKMTSM